MKYIDKKYQGLYLGMVANFIFFGVTLALPGMLLPGIIRDFGWNYTWAGVVLAASSVGYFVSTFISGFLVKKYSPRTVISVGLLFQSTGLLLFGAWPSIIINICVNFLLGFGQGGTEVVVNYTVVRMEREDEHHLMGFVHAGFSVGAVVAPLIGGFFLTGGTPWRMIFIASACISYSLVIFTLFLPFRSIEDVSDDGQYRPVRETTISRIIILFAVITILLYVGIEVGISNWISEYFVMTLGTSASSASFAVSLFWAGILAGRILIPLLIRKPSLSAQLISLTLILTLSILSAVLVTNRFVLSVSFLLAGIGCSSIYPLVMTLVGRYYRRNQSVYLGFVSTGGGIGSFIIPMNQSVYLGFVSTGGGIGSFIIPMIMASLADMFGLRFGFAFYCGLGFLMLFFVIGIHKGTQSITKQ
jgi:fucose permease